MGELWSETSKFATWLEVELAVCEAQAQLGLVPKEAFEQIKAKARFDIARIDEIELEVRHDMIAFLTCVGEHVGEASRFIHLGLTSSDVIDTALALQLVRAGKMLEADLVALHDAVRSQARKHKYTLTIGRSHGMHAEPLTFGYKLAVWLAEIRRHQERLTQALEMISVGKISGAVGTYANTSPQVEQIACERLGLAPAPIATQIIQRDRHAQFVWTLACIGSSLEKFATEIRHLQRTDVLEAEEPFAAGQKGSSAMPHKRNPVGSENITGLARILRANSLAALENIPLWHERDISHSSVERVILPDSTIALDYMLHRFTNIIANLVVYPDNMQANMDVFGGIVFSQAVLLKMVDKGVARDDAYRIVQSNAMKAWNTKDGSFKQNVLQDDKVLAVLGEAEIDQCFDPKYHLKNIDFVFDRLGI
jgi:adenylosuccinate lyase